VTVVFSLLGSLAEAVIRCMMVVAGYVTNSSTFPQPLNEEEEAKFLVRLQQGDDEARSVLIERNLRLVAHIVNRAWRESQGATRCYHRAKAPASSS
jgi:RNA polymerase sporulation-specific sigma factor